MGKSPAHISLLAILLSSGPHREALLKVLTAAQVPKETAPDLIEETVGSIFSNNISFSDDELPSEGYAYSRALHIVCKCNNFVVGRVMIDNGSALNETVVPYISIGDDQNLPFHSFDTISVIRDYGKASPSRADRMVGKILLRHNYIPGPQHIVGGTIDGPSSDLDDALVDLPGIYAVTEETPSGVYIRLEQENEELNNWTSVPRYSAVIADV
ncbi:hypothetical protein CRG98_043497 [Punica granatum]|uniref:Uncharacterized protein n=1 Tax=Punica granatum TaxID=22663 RepID=A0A2I0HWP1_PUNGR|nr:hypothetical protein CRG98_043497 [Punica granatum]